MKTKHVIHMVANTHFDPVWLWTWDEGLSSIRSTFKAALERIAEEPDFIYSFSCPPVFEWIRTVDPDLFAQIAERVREGRWELIEGWWLQADCNAASGESYARQGLYGQRYLLEHFGRMSACAFNIDSFGHSAMLPQILRQSSIQYYSFNRPGEKEKELPGPLFRWESPDGSSVIAYREPGSYIGDVEKHIHAAFPVADQYGHDLMLIYGVTNHGGAPTKKAIGKIKELASDPGVPGLVRFSKHRDFFAAQDEAALPVVRDELMTAWFGIFSNFPEIKQNNRRCEQALLNAEKAAVIAGWVNVRPYPTAKLTDCWHDVLFNQFHDILGGACISQAYFDARNLHGRAMQTAHEILHCSLQSVTKEIDLPANGSIWNVIAWNLNAFAMQTSVEVEVNWAWEFDWYQGPIAVTDDDGNEYPCQVIRERSVVPGLRSRFVFSAPLPSLGYKAFRVHQREPAGTAAAMPESNTETLVSSRFTVKICRENGCIASVFDLQKNAFVMLNGAKPLVLRDEGDTWAFNVSGFAEKAGDFKLEQVRLLEDGPVRATIHTKASFGSSWLEQDFTLYKESGIMTGSYRVNWRERHMVLKLGFQAVQEPAVTAAIPYGSIRRPADGKEMPMGDWLDLSCADHGFSILTNSLFAYHAEGTFANLTILRSSISGDLRLPAGLDPQAEYDYMGQGITEGRWGLVFHEGDWCKARIPQQAMQFCNPPLVITEANHPGHLSQEQSYVSIENNSSLLTVMKQAEDADGIIIRAYEYAGQSDPIQIRFPKKEFAFELDRYAIKTVCVSRDMACETDILEMQDRRSLYPEDQTSD
jgi:alpha-mannosidase